jgi:hypothetical protein
VVGRTDRRHAASLQIFWSHGSKYFGVVTSTAGSVAAQRAPTGGSGAGAAGERRGRGRDVRSSGRGRGGRVGGGRGGRVGGGAGHTGGGRGRGRGRPGAGEAGAAGGGASRAWRQRDVEKGERRERRDKVEGG